MADLVKFRNFTYMLASRVFNLPGDQLRVALCAAANAPSVDAWELAELTEIAYTYCSTRDVTTVSADQTGGVFKLVLGDLTLTATGGSVGPLRYVVLYDQESIDMVNALIGYYDRGSDLTLADGESLLLDFDGSNGVLTIA